MPKDSHSEKPQQIISQQPATQAPLVENSGDVGTAPPSRVSILHLTGIFLRIGATAFGGMMPMLAMIHLYLHEKYRYVDEDEIAEAIAVGQILPGPVAVDTATHIGFTLRGIAGGVLSTIAFILPASVMVIALSPLYFRYQHSPYLSAAMRGIGGVVIGLIAAATWRITRPAVKNWISAVIAAGSFLVLAVTPIHPVWVVVAAGVLGAVLLRPRTNNGEHGPQTRPPVRGPSGQSLAENPSRQTRPPSDRQSGFSKGGQPQ